MAPFSDKGSDLRGSVVNRELGRCPWLCDPLQVSGDRHWAGVSKELKQLSAFFLCASPELCPECREGLLCQQQRDLREYTQATIYIHKVVDNKKVRLSSLVLAHPGSVSFNSNCNKYPNNDLNTAARWLSQPPACWQDWDLLLGMLGGLWWWAGLLSAGKTHPALRLMEAIALAKRANGKILAGATLKIWSP